MSLTKITSEGIADGSIVNADLHSAANIDGTKIADNSIGGGKIPANQITNSHIATSTILRGNLSNNCIGTTEIIDTAVTLAKLEHGTSSNDGKFLRANNGADPTFETVDTTTNLGISTATDSVTVTSSTGNNAQISEASGSAAGVMSVAHHDKLDGIEASATADQTASEIVALIADQTIAPSEIDMEDSEKIKLGTSDDLEVYHDGTHSYVVDAGTGELRLGSNSGIRLTKHDSETVAFFDPDGAVELYWNNEKKMETYQYGVNFAQNIQIGTHAYFGDNGEAIFGDGSDLKIVHDGSNSRIIDGGTGNLNIDSSAVVIRSANASDNLAKFIQNGACELYHNGSKKAETVSGGFTVTGNISVSGTVDGRDVASDGSKLDGIESGATADQTASQILTLIKTVDGSGSGLDADLLDGNGSSHYLNYNNLSNKPSIPSAVTNNNQLTNGAGYMSGSTSQLAKAFVNYNGNNNSIRNDYNVSSISDHGNGDQTVNFSSSISMSYTVCGMPIAHDTGGTRCTNAIRGSSSSGPTRMNSTGVRINRGFGSHNAFQDGHTMCVAIFRP